MMVVVMVVMLAMMVVMMMVMVIVIMMRSQRLKSTSVTATREAGEHSNKKHESVDNDEGVEKPGRAGREEDERWKSWAGSQVQVGT